MDKSVAELFAGVGGFRLGLERSDFEAIYANQYEPDKKNQFAFDCYDKHFDKGIKSNGNIATVDTDDIPHHTLLVGGFPCQDYSVSRTQAEGLTGKKGVLFWEIHRILEAKRPPFILLENVDRLLKSPSKQRGRDFGVMLAALNKLGYGIEWRVINAADYGFPQRRRRTFIFGFHKSTKYYEDISQHTHNDIVVSEGFFVKKFLVQDKEHEKHKPTSTRLKGELDTISDNFTFQFRNSGIMMGGYIYSKETLPLQESPTTLRDILQSNVNEKYYLSDDFDKWEYMKGSKRIERTAKNGHKYTYSEGSMAFPDPLDKPARTMLTSEGSKNRSTHVVKDPETDRLRILTPIEAERINGFPDDWTEDMTDRQRYFCMGNALVVGLIERMGQQLSSIIENEK